MNELKNFIEKNGMYGSRYSDAYKNQFKLAGRRFIKELSTALKTEEVKQGYNPAGIACSGYHSAFLKRGDRIVYIHFDADGIGGSGGYYRTAKHMKDYTGGCNNWFDLTSPTAEIAGRIKNLLEPQEEPADVSPAAEVSRAMMKEGEREIEIVVSLFQGVMDKVVCFDDPDDARKYIIDTFGEQGKAYLADDPDYDDKYGYDMSDHEIHWYTSTLNKQGVKP